MTNAPVPTPGGVASDTATPLPPVNVTYKFKGSADFSMIEGLPAFESDDYYEQFFKDYIRVREIRDRMLGGHMVDEAAGAGATAGPPSTAYATPQGERVNPNPAPGAPPPQQPPVAAQGRAQNGQQQQRQAPEWQSWPIMEGWQCDRDLAHEIRERPAAGNAGRRAICHICKDVLPNGNKAHHVVDPGGWLDD